MNKRKLYTALIVAVLIALMSNVYAVEKTNVIKKDSVVLIEKTIITTAASEKPNAANDFATSDPLGFGMTIIVMAIVFVALIFLYLIFKIIGHLHTSGTRKKSLQKQGKTEEAAKINENESGEVFAAIAMALHLYQSQFHDEERTIITMEKVARTYSPWSSKIYGIRHRHNDN
ncbi:MAG: OadG family protein [Bacteroidetes bacterium]|nr:OadG family protein [Bacteroidota bacterium]